MKVITSQALDRPSQAEASDELPRSERLWCCPRCKFHRCFVTTETGPSSTIEYEVMICDNCAHVETRAARLDVVASLAAGGEHGVRLFEFRRDAQIVVGKPLPEAPRIASGPDIVAPIEPAGVMASGAEVPSPELHGLAPAVPVTVSASLDKTAALLRSNVGAANEEPENAGSGKMLTILLVVAGLGAGAWLLFGRSDEEDTPVPAPIVATVAVTSAPVDPLSGVPGAPHAVDPAALIEQARLVSGIGPTAVLTHIEASFVGSNGNVDLDNPHYKGQIIYRFEGRADAPPPPPRPEGVPLGSPGAGAPSLATYFRRSVRVSASGIVLLQSSDSHGNNNARPLPKEILSRCSFHQIWEAARTGDAPADAVATVNYRVKNDSPEWWFQIENTSFGFSVNPATCKRY